MRTVLFILLLNSFFNSVAFGFTDDYISYSAKRFHSDFVQSHFHTQVNFHKNTDEDMVGSVAYVEYDSKQQVCDVYIDEEGVRARDVQSEKRFLYILFHELAHCHLFTNPYDYVVFPDISELANLIFSDWVKFTFFENADDLEVPRAAGYWLHHETYADVKSISVLKAMGFESEQLGFIKNFRQIKSVRANTDNHQSDGVLDFAINTDWAAMSYVQQDQLIRQLSDEHLVQNYLSKSFNFTFFDREVVQSVTKNNIILPISNYFTNSSLIDEENIVAQLLNQSVNSPETSFRLMAGLLQEKSSADERQILESYYKERYGLKVDEDSAAYLEISKKIRTIK